MKLTKVQVSQFELNPCTIPAQGNYPERNGWKIDGYYLNGSDAYATKKDLEAALIGSELQPAKSGKSLVIVGSFQPIPVITDRLAKVLVEREEAVTLTIADLNAMLAGN